MKKVEINVDSKRYKMMCAEYGDYAVKRMNYCTYFWRANLLTLNDSAVRHRFVLLGLLLSYVLWSVFVTVSFWIVEPKSLDTISLGYEPFREKFFEFPVLTSNTSFLACHVVGVIAMLNMVVVLALVIIGYTIRLVHLMNLRAKIKGLCPKIEFVDSSKKESS